MTLGDKSASLASVQKVGDQGRSARADLVLHLKHSQFYQLVTLIGMLHEGLQGLGPGGDPAAEPIRFRSTRSLSFGAGDVSEITYDEDADRFDIRVNFFGLYGPASPLQPFLTERIIESDETPSPIEDLLDLFNHRLITLLFGIWQKSRYFTRFEPGGVDATSKCFLALCGFPIEDRNTIGSVPRSALLPLVGLMSLYSNSADVTSAMLTNFFKVPCSVIEYISRQIRVPEEAQLQLGVMNTSLGENAIVGNEINDDLGKFRVRMGVADFEALLPFLPFGQRHHEIAELLSMVIRDPLDWDLEFDFEPDSIPMGRLGESRLNQSFWLHADADVPLETPVQLSVVSVDSPNRLADAGF
ncbi:type VI secretion system baseplate subunit TssG [Roseibium polysiphoniae]|uniref:Type VI secretion system baseplate subunit TssG n=1 Tax=Roseibium polysiphoniae TaxID=2571221 RepID=A0A944GU80_9HYPH|nr:type VI secretion system baseplate subunit TssG [Roseibium polysiphoniae]MBS8262598.1 type VI secretion system baseplate subunit TssG [Roseibium polysiphoniae]